MRCIFSIFSLFLIFVFSCQESPHKTSFNYQKLSLNIPSDPMTLDPRKGGDLLSSVFHFMLFDGLTRLDDEGNVVLSLADKVIISENKDVYTFYLREAYWSDGTPITAWDFEKSWKDILYPDFPAMNAHLLYPIKNAEGAKKGTKSLSEVGITSLDAKTLVVTLEHPIPYFLDLVAFCVFYPVNAEVDQLRPDWDKEKGKNFVCSGPFCLKEWKKNNQIILAKNPYHFRSDITRLEEICLSIIDNEMTTLQMFEKGQVDIIGQPFIPLPLDAIPALIGNPYLHTYPIPATTFCAFNVEAFPLKNLHIRKAFAYAINRQQIVQNITQLNEPPALGIIPPILRKKEKQKEFFQDANIESARMHFKLGLEELGISKEEFPKIKYMYSSAEAHYKIAQALQQQWQESLGVLVELECVDKKNLLYHLKTRNYQMAQSFWIAQYQDPMNIFERFKYKDTVKNYPGWENQRYIQLLEASNRAKTMEERLALLDEAEVIFLEDMPLAPIFHWNTAYITKPYVKSSGEVAIGNGSFDKIFIDKEGPKDIY